jgi:hypothetical protein
MPVCLATGRGNAAPRRLGLWAALLSPVAIMSGIGAAGCQQPGVVLVLDRRQTVHGVSSINLRVSSREGEVEQAFQLAQGQLPATVELLVDGRTAPIRVTATALDDALATVAQGEASLAALEPSSEGVTLLLEPADFVVNSPVTGDQIASTDVTGRQVAVAADGSFMVVYETGGAVVGRRFDRQARPATNALTNDNSQFPISAPFGCCFHFNPTISVSGDRFLVGWENLDNEATTPTRYFWAAAFQTSNGAPEQSDLVAVSDQGVNRWGAVAGIPGGGFALSWLRSALDPLGEGARAVDGNVFTRTFAADGRAATAEQRAAVEATARTDYAHNIATLADDGYVVAWERLTSANTARLVARLFSSAGGPRSSEIEVTGTQGFHLLPAVAGTGNGGFAVAWVDNTVFPARVMLRVFDGTGVAGEPQTVGEIRGDQVYFPAIAVRERDQTIAVVWTAGTGAAPDTYDIFMRLFVASGAPLTEQMRVNTTTAGGQYSVSVAAGPEDSFIALWTDGSLAAPDEIGQAVRARVVYPPLVGAL